MKNEIISERASERDIQNTFSQETMVFLRFQSPLKAFTTSTSINTSLATLHNGFVLFVLRALSIEL
eukprot:m.18838 g.18838  ORF g.18838 m.18838 type:complete len:66 (+) comp5020_c0_seq1:92-289(+)